MTHRPDRVEAIARMLVKAAREGEDVGDILGAACSIAASRLYAAQPADYREDGDYLLTAGRPGSWEADHVRALAGGWDYQ